MDYSPLAKIPAEMRNRIYAAVFHQPSDLLYNQNKVLRIGSIDPPHALALCCQQLHDESIQVFYHINQIAIICPEINVGTTLATFTSEVGGKNAKATSGIHLVLQGFIPMPTGPLRYLENTMYMPLLALVLNMRDNSEIRDFCTGNKKVMLECRWQVEDTEHDMLRPFVFTLDCRNLKASLGDKGDRLQEGMKGWNPVPLPIEEIAARWVIAGAMFSFNALARGSTGDGGDSGVLFPDSGAQFGIYEWP